VLIKEAEMTVTRLSAVPALVACIVLGGTPSATAAQEIRYRGETSQGEDVVLRVLKRDSGRRFLLRSYAFFTATCEDSSTHYWSIAFGGRRRLNETGSFQIDFAKTGSAHNTHAYHIGGTVGFSSAEGTLEFRYASLNDAEEPQLCTSGELSWTARRLRR
jgi:hypothetical protein